MEKAWTSWWRKHWTGQRIEERRLAAWKCHRCYKQAPRQEEALALLGLTCSGWNLMLNFSVPQGKSGSLFLELTMAGKVGSARQITDKRSNCIISIVPRHPCSHDNILRHLQHWQPGRWLIISSQYSQPLYKMTSGPDWILDECCLQGDSVWESLGGREALGVTRGEWAKITAFTWVVRPRGRSYASGSVLEMCPPLNHAFLFLQVPPLLYSCIMAAGP